jgi:molybdopterin biosynthesis enzyme MoaB
MSELIKVGLLGLSQRVGRFNELGLRSWEESGCAEVERWLLADLGSEIYYIHRPLVVRGGLQNVERLLKEWCDAPRVDARCDLILTVAGIGLGPDDDVPDATEASVRRLVPGVAELVRYAAFQSGHYRAAGRGICGIRKSTLIINLPGPDTEVIQGVMEVLIPILPGFVQDVQREPAK